MVLSKKVWMERESELSGVVVVFELLADSDVATKKERERKERDMQWKREEM